ncbi:MAG: helix-turn-helix domain-containing protein [Phycisphaerales bacterium]|nr:helix-turn-helix domain-containing protein [Planctomycetota bacterium]MCH8508163.1 helix-turn-helix domain-containing protein [Phycisphaerales bacterium]
MDDTRSLLIMAKMFYTLEEAAAKLGMSEDEVRNLTESGQLQEFRDRDRLMFKVDQVDLLAGDDGDEDVQLADTGTGIEPISLSSSNTGTGPGVSLGDSNANEGTGVSIFDPEDDDAADANAETLVTSGLGGSGFEMDAGSSGSGLAQLAFEPDDTSLGGNLLDSMDSGDSQADAAGTGAGALFETAGGEPDFSAGAAPATAMVMPMGEPYDGPASGLFGGIALGVFALLLLSLAVMILGISGGSTGVLTGIDQNMLYIIAGGGAVALILFGVIGWALLRKS